MGDCKYFIIGGSGYIGSALVAAVPNGKVAIPTASADKNEFLQLSLDDLKTFSSLPVSEDDVVFLTAAISSPDICVNEYDRAWSVNVAGTSALIDSVIQRGARVIFFSSDTVYGEREKNFDESAVCNPAGEYAFMKHEIEKRFAGNTAFKAIRLSYVFSKEDKFTRYLLECSKQEKEAEIFHPFYRSIIHRDDVVRGALALAEKWHEIPEQFINFGGPDVLSRIDFTQSICKKCLKKLSFKVIEPNVGFFKNRPRIIAMKSPILSRLLKREARTLSDAIDIEFNILSSIKGGS